MATLTPDRINDLVNMTLPKLDKGKWTDLSSDLQKHTAWRQLIRQKKVEASAGKEISFQAMTGHSNAAKMVGLYESDDVNVVDVMQDGSVPWRNAQTFWALDKHLISMNSEPASIVKLLKAQRAAGRISMAELLETQVWSKPEDSDDKLSLWGIPTWIVKNSTKGFTGGNPAGFTDGVAFNSSTYARWKNWSETYTTVDHNDFIKKAREAAVKTNFMAPVDDIPQPNTGDDRQYYTTYTVLAALEDALRNQNDNLGNDIAAKDGRVMFRRRPVNWVPQLDSDTENPWYGINWGWMHFEFLEGWYFVESKAKDAPLQHNVTVVYVDATGNLVCKNRREQSVLYNPA